MAYHQPFQITGFHSCDKEVGLDVLNGKKELNHSNNTWDWLGSGIYFWEENPARALEYAEKVAIGRQKNKIKNKTPFVIGAIIELGNCLNLLEPKSLSIVKKAHDSLEALYKEIDKPMPKNNDARRELDCAVIKYVHEINRKEREENGNKDELPYDTIRCAFLEGDKIYKDSNFTDRLHIEICVINKELIKGYFLPLPIQEFNPYLNKDFDADKCKRKYGMI
ncbi:MAG TPA: hypothetical protein VHZ50_12950 [Puia sp.]|jgi:hypothetical protein|nr:hypothetical protein [Puia sp.]